MISFLRGTIIEKNAGTVIVDIGGVGYSVNTSLNTIDSIGTIGNDVTLRTTLIVREDLVALYGFVTKEELTLFEKLISVSGVGPKVALGILSYISPAEFAVSVLNEDIKKLTKISGVGPKSAQRIIFELKDKIRKDYKNIGADAAATKNSNTVAAGTRGDNVIIALCTLGFTTDDAQNAVNTVLSSSASADVAEAELSEEELLRQALRRLSRK